MKKRIKKSLASILMLMLTLVVFCSVPIIANAAYSYPAYFEVTKPKDGKNYAVYHTNYFGDSTSYKIDLGTRIEVVDEKKNEYGHIWYKFKKGSEFRWIYSVYVSYRGTISDYSATMETINGGKYWTKPWSDETSKYTSSGEFGNGKVIKVSKKINRNGTIWYKVYNESKFIYSGNVKTHTHTKTTISRYNYKSVSATQHSYDYTYRLCNNSTCENYSQTKNANTKADHVFNNGICSKCQYWKVKSKTDISNVKYVVTTDNAKVHKGPYGSCDTVKTLPKGTKITVTQSVKNYESHTWYKYSGGYIYSDYVKKHSSCTWNSGEWITKATCTTSGSKKYTCTLCGVTKTETVNALGHNYVDGVCSRCKAWKVKSKTDISNVKYVVTADNAKVHKGPYGSCDTVKTLPKGTKITVTQSVKNYESHTWYKYSGGYIYSNYVKKHTSCTWDSGVYTKKPTCTETGIKIYTCTLCGATKTNSVKSLGHNYNKNVCTRCNAWNKKSLKSTEVINNANFVVVKDNAKIHNGPYSACSTVKTISKNSVINITRSVVNAENNTWYKCDDGYIYSDYVIVYDAIFHGNKTIMVKDVIGENKKFAEYVNSLDSSTYSPKLAYMLAGLSRSAYIENNIKKTYLSLGFDEIKTYKYDGNKFTAAHAIGKKILSDGTSIVLITIRGSYSSGNWLSDFYFDTENLNSGNHRGFNASANNVYKNLKAFMGGEIPSTNTKYIITGHSFGAANGNLLAVKLSEFGVEKSKVFNYNYACPDVARGSDLVWNPKGVHDNIFNIGYAKDYISVLPGLTLNTVAIGPALTWGKYGKSFWFSNNWSKASEVNLDPTFKAHDCKNYIAYLSKYKKRSEYKSWAELTVARANTVMKSVIHCIFCPVDVDVYDSKGKLVASVKNNEVIKYNRENGEVLVFVEGDQKYVSVPADKNYDIRLTGNDTGTMTYTAIKADLATKEVESQKTFDNVALTEGKAMETASFANAEVKDTRLYVIDSKSDIIAEVSTSGKETKKVSMNKVKVSGIKSKTYNGKALTQSITVKYGKTTLKKGTDYTVSYINNKKVGTSTITVTGKGKYIGIITKTFKINPKGTSISSVSAKAKGFKVIWKKQTNNTSGYQIQYASNSAFTKNKKTVTINKNSTTNKNISKLKGGKKYYVRIRAYKSINGKKYYSAWSKSRSVTTKN